MSTGRTVRPKVHTHYDNLKVARDAPIEVIRAAYKSLSQKHHPDRNSGDPNAAHRMAIINAAYKVLSDPDLRKAHDEWIRKAEAKSAPPPPQQPSRAPGQTQPSYSKAQAPALTSTSPVINHLRRYWWIYVFLALVECLLMATLLILGG